MRDDFDPVAEYDDYEAVRPDYARSMEEVRRSAVNAVALYATGKVDRSDFEKRIEILEARAEYNHRRIVASFRRGLVMMVVGILFTAWLAIDLHQVFIGQCVNHPFLTQTRANVCNSIFVGDKHYTPGPNTINPERIPPHSH